LINLVLSHLRKNIRDVPRPFISYCRDGREHSGPVLWAHSKQPR
jgi:hypothetical protein